MKLKIIAAVVLIVIIAVPVVLYRRPLPSVTVAMNGPKTSVVAGKLSLPMPSAAESAVDVTGVGVMSSAGNKSGIPIGSVAKIMTAYLVLEHHPLKAGQSGPTYQMTKNDANVYLHDKAIGDSYVKVVAGQKWTERQMLEGLLLPSGDNMAHTLAVWTDGSEQAFVAEMNQTAKKLGMLHTNYADASGVSQNTTSTVLDQLHLAEVAMKNPVFRHIVDMAQATLPGASKAVYNVDYYVGHYGIVGIKTGSTPQAGGCFVSATYDHIGGQKLLLLGAVFGQRGTPMLIAALKASRSMLQEAEKNLTLSTLAQGTVVAKINVPWQGQIALETAKPVSYLSFPGLTVSRKLMVQGTKGHTSYSLRMQVGEEPPVMIPLRQMQPIEQPTLKWRLLRGMKLQKKL